MMQCLSQVISVLRPSDNFIFSKLCMVSRVLSNQAPNLSEEQKPKHSWHFRRYKMKSGRDESKQEADQDLLLTQAVNCHLSIVIAVLFFPFSSSFKTRSSIKVFHSPTWASGEQHSRWERLNEPRGHYNILRNSVSAGTKNKPFLPPLQVEISLRLGERE